MGLVRKQKHRTYSVDINPKIFEENAFPNARPNVRAIQGILAHELFHLVDFETGNAGDLLTFGFRELVLPAGYERETDRRAFERGFALGIKAYREWLYPNLSKRALRLKKRRYYTPSEIDEWISSHSETKFDSLPADFDSCFGFEGARQ